ncbi:MAG: hypothetical protein DIJKHBIC_04253 [Thermoanaerobaculia bacterium]|nr:hypothetical protein [Thermoanaerobaculia bacterium]
MPASLLPDRERALKLVFGSIPPTVPSIGDGEASLGFPRSPWSVVEGSASVVHGVTIALAEAPERTPPPPRPRQPRMTFVERPQPETSGERLRIAFELFELAEAMVRQNWRRKHPGASEEELDAAVADWLSRRPGAEHGDAEGRPMPWPRQP